MAAVEPNPDAPWPAYWRRVRPRKFRRAVCEHLLVESVLIIMRQGGESAESRARSELLSRVGGSSAFSFRSHFSALPASRTLPPLRSRTEPPTQTPSSTQTPASVTSTALASPTASPSVSPTPTATTAASPTAGPSATVTATPTSSSTAAATLTPTRTGTPTVTFTRSATPTGTFISSDPDPYADAESDIDEHVDANADEFAVADAESDENAVADANLNAHLDACASDPDEYADENPHQRPDEYADGDANSADGNADRHADGNADRHADRDADGNADPLRNGRTPRRLRGHQRTWRADPGALGPLPRPHRAGRRASPERSAPDMPSPSARECSGSVARRTRRAAGRSPRGRLVAKRPNEHEPERQIEDADEHGPDGASGDEDLPGSRWACSMRPASSRGCTRFTASGKVPKPDPTIGKSCQARYAVRQRVTRELVFRPAGSDSRKWTSGRAPASVPQNRSTARSPSETPTAR